MGTRAPDEPFDLPPQNTFLSLYAVRMGSGLGNRVILAREPAAQQVESRHLADSPLDVVEHSLDVRVHAGTVPEAFFVASPGELLGGAAGRFPLVRPNGLHAGTRNAPFLMPAQT